MIAPNSGNPGVAIYGLQFSDNLLLVSFTKSPLRRIHARYLCVSRNLLILR